MSGQITHIRIHLLYNIGISSLSGAGAKITPTANKTGLIMTYGKTVSLFQCDSENNCFWTKQNHELKISRKYHVFMTVPTSLVYDCYD